VIKNTIYQQIPENEDAGIWNYRNFEACILLDNPQNIDLVLDNFRANFRHDSFDWDKYDLRLTKLPDIYYTTDITFDSQTTKGNRIQIFVLFCIALLIIFIAAINFVNFSNALIPARIRNINTQKILGCSVNSLRLSMIVEAVIICFMSFLIAIVLLLFLQETVFSDIVSGGISISSHSGLIIGTGVFAIIIAILSGCWPAVQITSYPPALVLKGNF
jgi:putative ABC transport system permease protein